MANSILVPAERALIDEHAAEPVDHGFAGTLGGTPRELTPVAPYPIQMTEFGDDAPCA